MRDVDLNNAVQQAARETRRLWSVDRAVDKDDLAQSAVLAVLENAALYSPARCAVSTFARKQARWGLSRERTYRSRHAPLVRASIHSTSETERGVAWDLADTESLEGLERTRARQDARVLIDRLLQCPGLADRDRSLLTGRYGLDGSPPARGAELARRFGVSETRINQLLSRALDQLRSYARFAQLDPDIA